MKLEPINTHLCSAVPEKGKHMAGEESRNEG
jgi:hypothetical protein